MIIGDVKSDSLAGIHADGGRNPDASSHGAWISGVNGFMFRGGARNRWVSDVPRSGPVIQPVWPGGISAIPGSEFYIYPMLPRWLTNDANPIRFSSGDVRSSAVTVQEFVP